MSSIKSNSLGDANLHDYQSLDPQTKVLQTILSVPLSIPQQTAYLIPKTNYYSQLNHRVHLKTELFLKCILNDVRYKSQLKKLSINAAEVDRMKAICGMPSCQKEIVKFTVLLKHEDVTYCRKYLNKIFARILLGEEQKEDDY